MQFVDPMSARTSAIGPNGPVADFVRSFLAESSKDSFREWASHPVTKLVSAAMRDLSISGPRYGLTTDGYSVQYGMSLGLGIASQLLDNPSSVFPQLFSGTVQVDQAEPSFSTSPDQMLDSMENQ